MRDNIKGEGVVLELNLAENLWRLHDELDFQRFPLMLCDTQPAQEWQSAVWILRYYSTSWDTLILM